MNCSYGKIISMDIEVSNKRLRDAFPYLKEWCGDHLWAQSCFHGSVGNGWDVVEKYISAHNTYEYKRE